MAYYPKSRIKSGLISEGNEFLLENGEFYKGPYFITFDGKYYTGENQFSKNSKTLSKNINEGQSTSKDVFIFNNINPQLKNQSTLIDPPFFNVIVNDIDFNRGKIVRYFAKERKVRNFKIIEINKESYDDISHRRGKYSYYKWDVILLIWNITNQRLSKEFINSQNEKVLKIKNKQFIGIKDYLSNLNQFSKFGS